MSQSLDSKKKGRAQKSQKGCKLKEEIGIPTIFTPVPSQESCLLAEQCLRRLRDSTPLPLQPLTSELSSFRESTTNTTYSIPSEIMKSILDESQYPPFDTRDLTRLALIRVYFMQNLFTSFELATDRTLIVLLRFVLNGISKEIRNKFSFYVFASPFEVIWKRPRCELMKKPPPESIFRQLLTPSQMNLTLAELFEDIKTEGLETMNIYIFIKNMEDTYTPDESPLVHKSWKYQQVVK